MGMPQIEFGVYVIENKDMPFPEMIRQGEACAEGDAAAGRQQAAVCIYDDAARSRMFREKQLSDVMEDALKNREFQVYLQPKYHPCPRKRSAGRKRWCVGCSRAEGMIYPDEIYPIV